ncbi:MAG: (2Fe-2S)-binding protein [Acidimicrobiales bacterium]
MIVCHCALVSRNQLLAEIESGATTIDEVAERCGAAQHCGGCLSAVERILATPRRVVAAVA